MNVLLIDNFDSFTFNLVDDFERRGCKVEVYRNDVSPERALERVLGMAAPRLVVLSPGPGAPADAGCCVELIRRAAGKVALLGVCLGHQALVEAMGGRVGAAGEIVHGKAVSVDHDGEGVFSGLPRPMPVARYHSLVALDVPDSLRVRARCRDLVMAVEHREHRLLGVQFHPESVLTPAGGRFLENVMAWAS
jgi:anthranilate synthase/aminodeoxychorismate synthase-like glutamine amidotransferase